MLYSRAQSVSSLTDDNIKELQYLENDDSDSVLTEQELELQKESKQPSMKRNLKSKQFQFEKSLLWLTFRDPQINTRFCNFLAIQQNFYGSVIAILLPVFAMVISISVSYLTAISQGMPWPIVLIGLAMQLLVLIVTVRYMYFVKVMSKVCREIIASDAKYVSDIRANQIDMGRTAFVERYDENEISPEVRQKQVMDVQTHAAIEIFKWAYALCILAVVSYSQLVVTRTLYIPCEIFCAYNIPLIPMISLNYLPFHFLTCIPCKWSTVLLTDMITKSISLTCVFLVFDPFVLFTSHAKEVASGCLLWATWLVALWYIYHKNITIFIQREVLMEYVVLEERRFLEANFLWLL